MALRSRRISRRSLELKALAPNTQELAAPVGDRRIGEASESRAASPLRQNGREHPSSSERRCSERRRTFFVTTLSRSSLRPPNAAASECARPGGVGDESTPARYARGAHLAMTLERIGGVIVANRGRAPTLSSCLSAAENDRRGRGFFLVARVASGAPSSAGLGHQICGRVLHRAEPVMA